ncbi:hypothetical protein D3C76_1825060 [compost metagenome]
MDVGVNEPLVLFHLFQRLRVVTEAEDDLNVFSIQGEEGVDCLILHKAPAAPHHQDGR